MLLTQQKCIKIILIVYINKLYAGKSAWFKTSLMQVDPT